MLSLDHIFMFTPPQARSFLNKISANGLTLGKGRSHPGQGTANHCIYFANSYFEAIWKTDDHEICSPETAKTQLYERANWAETGYSPFGIAMRYIPGQDIIPGRTWSYQPKFLGEGLEILVDAEVTGGIQKLKSLPYMFFFPYGSRPDSRPIGHPANVDKYLLGENRSLILHSITLTLPQLDLPASLTGIADYLVGQGIIKFITGPAHFMEVTFLGGKRDRIIDFRPDSPLAFKIKKTF